MLSSVTNSALVLGDSGTSSPKQDKETTTKDQFLKMLIAQMKNQDPLQPPDATQFANQMTSFGQLEQLFNINSTLGNLASAGNNAGQFDAVSMIGKKVEAVGNQLEVGNGPSEIAFSVDKAAKDVSVRIRDNAGQTVRTFTFQDQSAGAHHYDFDGKDINGVPLPAGTYRVEVAAEDAQGQPVVADPLMLGTVTGVDFQSGVVQLFVGSRVLTMQQILSVRS